MVDGTCGVHSRGSTIGAGEVTTSLLPGCAVVAFVSVQMQVHNDGGGV